MYVQQEDSVPLSCEVDNMLSPFDSFSWTGLCNSVLCFPRLRKKNRLHHMLLKNHSPPFPLNGEEPQNNNQARLEVETIDKIIFFYNSGQM